MRARIRSYRPSHATAVAYLALFVALGGSSYAAVTLKRNSVKGRHIAKNAVTSPKVKDWSLLARDFAAGQLPQGERGRQGEEGPMGLQGPKGDQGPTGTVDTSNFYDKAASDNRFLQALGGSSFTRADAPLSDTSVSHGVPGHWTVTFSCPDPPASFPGSLVFSNTSNDGINLFTDVGGANPSHLFLPAQSTTGSIPTAQSGDAVDFDAQGWSDGTIAHVRILTLNRANDCHAQWWAMQMKAGGGVVP
jgi:hypothetical protein